MQNSYKNSTFRVFVNDTEVGTGTGDCVAAKQPFYASSAEYQHFNLVESASIIGEINGLYIDEIDFDHNKVDVVVTNQDSENGIKCFDIQKLKYSAQNGYLKFAWSSGKKEITEGGGTIVEPEQPSWENPVVCDLFFAGGNFEDGDTSDYIDGAERTYNVSTLEISSTEFHKVTMELPSGTLTKSVFDFFLETKGVRGYCLRPNSDVAPTKIAPNLLEGWSEWSQFNETNRFTFYLYGEPYSVQEYMGVEDAYVIFANAANQGCLLFATNSDDYISWTGDLCGRQDFSFNRYSQDWATAIYFRTATGTGFDEVLGGNGHFSFSSDGWEYVGQVEKNEDGIYPECQYKMGIYGVNFLRTHVNADIMRALHDRCSQYDTLVGVCLTDDKAYSRKTFAPIRDSYDAENLFNVYYHSDEYALTIDMDGTIFDVFDAYDGKKGVLHLKSESVLDTFDGRYVRGAGWIRDNMDIAYDLNVE